ncbi:hypothetical protein MNBD_BACTEROID03-25 [hydrothermal vent metagenome]|uniref:Uncharacterized protein n=1 Tax=hydrothermal vent metagenome TaxID=652676 RepID=A0A3B0TTJ8_9ZZZZ
MAGAKQGSDRGTVHPALFPRAEPTGIPGPRSQDKCRGQEEGHQQATAQKEHKRFYGQKEEGQTAGKKILQP